ncbi:MAG: carboxypeptidase regulatory-like domain-containing protein [Acidobacteria bacterium]|nr:carboxypeptidase regulatory-like domain-containing protein [Acidobacteriota bacterium]
MRIGFKRGTALLLTAAIVCGSLPALAATAPTAAVRGRVFSADLKTPAPGLMVQAIPDQGGDPLAQATTDAKGRFALAGLPDGTYVLLLSDGKGAPMAAARVTANAGKTETVALALPEKTGTTTLAPSARRLGAWISTPLGATVTLVAAAVVIGLAADDLTDDDESRENLPPVSPSTR